MKKSQRIILIIIIVLIILIAIILGTYVKIKKENGEPDQYEYEWIDEIQPEREIKPVEERNKYYIVEECTNKFYTYYMTIFNMEETYGKIDNDMLENAKMQNAEVLYNMLDSEYISLRNITKNNICDKLETIKTSTIDINNMYVSEQTDKISVYMVKGTLREKKSQKVIEFQIIVKVDYYNETFSVIPQDYVEEKYKDLKIGGNIEINVEENIEKNTNNSYTFKNVSDETYIIDLFRQFKLEVIDNKSIVYNILNEEYRSKKFNSEEDFEQYIENNKERYSTMQIGKYQKTVEDDYTQYICIDQNGNYYIFRETSVMNYEVILDTYTIDLPEFIEKYNSSNDQIKVGMNIEKVFEAINEKDYQYVYNKLDNTFKDNNYKTLEDFEKYIENNLYSNNNVEYSKFSTQGENYIYELKITEGNNTSSKEKDVTIVMKLEEGTDFVMSFNIE